MKNSGGAVTALRWTAVRLTFVFAALGSNALRALFAVGAVCLAASLAEAQLAPLRLVDYATMPMTGSTNFPSATANSAYLARVNFLADEPGNPGRFFVNDLNGPLYMLDKDTRQFTEYLNFNGRSGGPGLYERLWTSAGFAGGFVTFQFDPGYADPDSGGYGKFYTVHVEQGNDGSLLPNTSNYPNIDISSYGITAPVVAPGSTNYQNIVVEWTDSDISNSTFEGSARELLRINARDRIHPIGDILFNPTAGPEDPDWRVMYISVGDAGNGEQSQSSVRRTPQLLNALGGKILRIIPDLDGGNIDSTVSPNGKYRIPDDNPFTTVANSNVRDEIWALGLRNPHRMAWDVDPANPESNHLIVNDIGLHTWEEVNIIHKGANYGYSPREGNELLISSGDSFNTTTSLPNPDTIPKDLVCTGGATGFSNCTNSGTVTPLYPVIQYGHGRGQPSDFAGDSVSSGYVYRGSKIPQLYGKYIFGDITTGQIFYADFEEMLAADDGDPSTLATIHALEILWDSPFDAPDAGEQLYSTTYIPGLGQDLVYGPMFDIVQEAYHGRGGNDPNLPGGAAVTGPLGRADIRIAIDDDGELYILSKSDGMIRAIVGPERIPGDYNFDGIVDEIDYEVWNMAFGSTVPVPGLGADGNADGFVDAADYTVWRDAFGSPPAAGVGVPEPTTCLLAMAGILAGLTIRRRDARRQ